MIKKIPPVRGRDFVPIYCFQNEQKGLQERGEDFNFQQQNMKKQRGKVWDGGDRRGDFIFATPVSFVLCLHQQNIKML